MRHHGAPVRHLPGRLDAGETSRRVGMMQGFRGPDHGFGRHAAHVDAGAADGAMADQGHLGALLGGGDGGGKSGRSSADHGKVTRPIRGRAIQAHDWLSTTADFALLRRIRA